MYEQDYVMREIGQLAYALARMLFHINTQYISTEIIRNEESRTIAEELLRKMNNGETEQAEKELFTLTADGSMDNLLIGLVFYSNLNDKSDEELEKQGYSRDTVKENFDHLVSVYGLDTFADLFFYE